MSVDCVSRLFVVTRVDIKKYAIYVEIFSTSSVIANYDTSRPVYLKKTVVEDGLDQCNLIELSSSNPVVKEVKSQELVL